MTLAYLIIITRTSALYNVVNVWFNFYCYSYRHAMFCCRIWHRNVKFTVVHRDVLKVFSFWESFLLFCIQVEFEICSNYSTHNNPTVARLVLMMILLSLKSGPKTWNISKLRLIQGLRLIVANSFCFVIRFYVLTLSEIQTAERVDQNIITSWQNMCTHMILSY